MIKTVKTRLRPSLIMSVLAFSSMAGLCGKSSTDFQVKVQNKSKASLSCSIRLNQKVDLKTLNLDPGASIESQISLGKIREELKSLGQSTGALHLKCDGLQQAVDLELFGYIEPADNYLSGKEIVAEISDVEQSKVNIHEWDRRTQ